MQLKLRDWQEKAKIKCLKWFNDSKDNRFVLNCAPGTGKTFAAIAIAHELLENKQIETVIVIAPQDSVVDKWAEDFFSVTGKFMQRTHQLDGDTGTHYCSTWQSMSSLLDGYQRICNQKKTMVICDEQHHAAAAAVWGNSAVNAFENAKYILMLSGTPIRSDSQEPAFLPYEGGELAHPKDGQYILTYGEAIKLGYCRPIAFERHEANFDILDEDGDPIKEKSIENKKFSELNSNAIIGTSSYRREFQLKRIRDDLNYKTIRGNIDTRISKINNKDYDGIILAKAGIKSLELDHLISQEFSTQEIIPSAGQGIVSIQCREGDIEVINMLSEVNDKNSSISAHAERKVLKILEGDCYTAVGVFSKINKDNFKISGELFSLDGKQRFFKVIEDKISNFLKVSIELGNYLKKESRDSYKK